MNDNVRKYRDQEKAWQAYERQARTSGVHSAVRKGHDEEGDYWYLLHQVDPYDAPIRSKVSSDA